MPIVRKDIAGDLFLARITIKVIAEEKNTDICFC